MNISQLANICLSHSAVSARILLPLYTLWINSACSSTNTGWRRFFFLSPVWFIHHCLRTVNGTKFTCLPRHEDPSSVPMAKLFTTTEFFPSQLCFPRTHSKTTCGSTPQRDKTDLSSLKGSRDVYFYSLAEIPGWSQQILKSLEDPATSVRLLSDFSALKICATLQGWVSQLGSIACTGCTISIEFCLSSFPLLSSLFRGQLLQSSCCSSGFCLVALLVHTLKSGWEEYIHIQNLPYPHFTAWKLILSEGTSPLCWHLVQLL